MHLADHNHRPGRPAWRGKWPLLALLAVAVYLLWAGYSAELLLALPYLLVLACPLMHLLHHRHGRRHSRDSHAAAPDTPATPARAAQEERHEQ